MWVMGLLFYFTVPCTYRDDCSFGSWGGWEGNIKVNNPGCYKQTRSKPYNHPLQTVMRRHGCGGLNTNCAAPPVQSRMQCMYTCPFVSIIRYTSSLKSRTVKWKKFSVSICPFVAVIGYTFDFVEYPTSKGISHASLLAFEKPFASLVRINLEK